MPCTGNQTGRRLLLKFSVHVLKKQRKPKDGLSRGIITSYAIWSGRERKPSSGLITHCGGSSGSLRVVSSYAGGPRNCSGAQTGKGRGRTSNSGQMSPCFTGCSKHTGGENAKSHCYYRSQNIDT